jgi:transcriptional regulator with XRE-family HTH domain
LFEKHREQIEMTKAEAAEAAGLTTVAYSRFSNGIYKDVKLSTLEAIAEGLGVEVDISIKPKRKVKRAS